MLWALQGTGCAKTARLHFWRTTSKTEVDIIAERQGKPPLPIEVKFQRFTEAEIGRSLYGFLDEYKPGNCLVVTKDFWGESAAKGTKARFVPISYV